jgi:hypothetical protein
MMDNLKRIETLCGKVVRGRPVQDAPPWFAFRVMAHVRERAQAGLDSWFLTKVAGPLVAGGGAVAAGLAGWCYWLNVSSSLGQWLMEISARPWLTY